MEKKEFKVGDKVLLTKSSKNWGSGMTEHVGKIATIIKIRDDGHGQNCEIDLDEGCYTWQYHNGHFVSAPEEKKPKNVLKFNDIVNFYLVGKGNYQYQVKDSYLNTGDDTNAKIFIELGMSPDEKRQICDKAYGYQARYDGQWPECKEGDYEALTRLVNMLYLECNIYNKRVRDLKGIEV